MNNNKRNIHNSGPLGILVQSGQVKKIEDSKQDASKDESHQKTNGLYFKTQSGIEFSENELLYVDPKECEPWKYANRQEDELGDIDELIESIKANKQLQPALIRKHPAPHDGIKYEIIFGRRRHIACSKLSIPFLAIKKDIPNVQDAIASQDAENKLRNDVSNYSNAKLYQKLLLDGVFKTEKELADKLRLSTSTLHELMAYSKIPADIVKKIPNIHGLSKQIVVKLVQLLNKSEKNHAKILLIADKLGKSITSQAKLENLFEKNSAINLSDKKNNSRSYCSNVGEKLFVLKSDYRGLPTIVLNKKIANIINTEKMCDHFLNYIENEIKKSEYSDS